MAAPRGRPQRRPGRWAGKAALACSFPSRNRLSPWCAAARPPHAPQTACWSQAFAAALRSLAPNALGLLRRLRDLPRKPESFFQTRKSRPRRSKLGGILVAKASEGERRAVEVEAVCVHRDGEAVPCRADGAQAAATRCRSAERPLLWSSPATCWPAPGTAAWSGQGRRTWSSRLCELATAVNMPWSCLLLKHT